MSAPSIRPLTSRDFVEADRLLRSAYGRTMSFLPNLEINCQVEPRGWWAAEIDGRLAGTVGAVTYGALAYVGLMAVNPAQQRQGLGLRLLEHLLDRLRRLGCATVLLDATPSGAPLYERLGFVDHSIASVLVPPAESQAIGEPLAAVDTTGPTIRPLAPLDLDEIVEFDRLRFGADRRRLLELLARQEPERGLVARDRAGQLAGYLFAREPSLGPWVARDMTTAAELFDRARLLPFTEPPGVLVPRSNGQSLALLTARGYTVTRTLRHMRLGEPLRCERPSELFGQASFALG